LSRSLRSGAATIAAAWTASSAAGGGALAVWFEHAANAATTSNLGTEGMPNHRARAANHAAYHHRVARLSRLDICVPGSG
jgi:hypothetical protein